MKTLTFTVETDEDGVLCARWDEPGGGGISTFGHSLNHLLIMVDEAVRCHFDEHEFPKQVRLHFLEDPIAINYAEASA